MPKRNIEPEIQSIWEHIDDPKAVDLLFQAIQLILRDDQAPLDVLPIDKNPQPELN
jgi:hypothetical protein